MHMKYRQSDPEHSQSGVENWPMVTRSVLAAASSDSSACLLAMLLVWSLLPVLLYRFLPFHDYPNGVFQGYLLRLARVDPATLAEHYSWTRAPVPYSAWSAVA